MSARTEQLLKEIQEIDAKLQNAHVGSIQQPNAPELLAKREKLLKELTKAQSALNEGAVLKG